VTNAKADPDHLLDAIMQFVLHNLQKYGEFYPIGLALGVDGKIEVVLGGTDVDPPPPAEAIEIIKGAFIEGADSGRFKATALAYDVLATLPERGKSDAIEVDGDHRDGYSVKACFPYEFDGEKLVIHAERVFAVQGDDEIFPR
jgi:hypothetical protein